MTDKSNIDIIDAVNIATPQLNFLVDVLSYNAGLELTGNSTGGLASILTTISEQLEQAVREVTHVNSDT
jgi:hypothetical protein